MKMETSNNKLLFVKGYRYGMSAGKGYGSHESFHVCVCVCVCVGGGPTLAFLVLCSRGPTSVVFRSDKVWLGLPLGSEGRTRSDCPLRGHHWS